VLKAQKWKCNKGVNIIVKKVTLTIKEVSEILGIPNGKIYELVRMSQIPHTKVGSRVIFHEDVLREWMGAAGVSPKGPLLTPLPFDREVSDEGIVGTRYEMHLTVETIRSFKRCWRSKKQISKGI